MLTKTFSLVAKSPDRSIGDQLGLQLLAMMKDPQTPQDEILKFIESNQYSGINAINFFITDTDKIYTPASLALLADKINFQHKDVAELILSIEHQRLTKASDKTKQPHNTSNYSNQI
jgi:hypothetical protein